MTLPAVLILFVVLMTLVRVFISRRRARIRAELLRSGTRLSARVVQRRGRGDAVASRNSGTIIVGYTSPDGIERQAVKLPQSKLDSWMAGEPVSVLIDPRRPGDTERVLVGFGRTEKRWFRARLRQLPKPPKA